MEMKICSTCKVSKAVKLFGKASDKTDNLKSSCKQCCSDKAKASYQRNSAVIKKQVYQNKKIRIISNRQKLGDYLSSHPCVGVSNGTTCGISDIRTLDFDHLPAYNKRMSVSDLMRGDYSWDVIYEEIQKCEVRCRNCHVIETYNRAGNDWRSAFVPTPLK